MEKFEFIVSERNNGRFVCLNKYLYRKRKTVGEKDYYSCVDKCSASLQLSLGEISNINENHKDHHNRIETLKLRSLLRKRASSTQFLPNSLIYVRFLLIHFCMYKNQCMFNAIIFYDLQQEIKRSIG